MADKQKKPRGVVELADLVAQDLVNYAQRNGLTAEQLVQTSVLVGRLVTRVYPGTPEMARAAVFEAHATFEAMTRPMAENDQN